MDDDGAARDVLVLDQSQAPLAMTARAGDQAVRPFAHDHGLIPADKAEELTGIKHAQVLVQPERRGPPP
jgi:hypothetical protein